MVVFAVWEPIPSDWSAPGTGVLQRLSDRRVRQFWDPNHTLAAAIKKPEASGKLHPDCCERKGFLWDLTGIGQHRSPPRAVCERPQGGGVHKSPSRLAFQQAVESYLLRIRPLMTLKI